MLINKTRKEHRMLAALSGLAENSPFRKHLCSSALISIPQKQLAELISVTETGLQVMLKKYKGVGVFDYKAIKFGRSMNAWTTVFYISEENLQSLVNGFGEIAYGIEYEPRVKVDISEVSDEIINSLRAHNYGEAKNILLGSPKSVKYYFLISDDTLSKPTDLMTEIKEIKAILLKHEERFESIDKRFESIEKRLDKLEQNDIGTANKLVMHENKKISGNSIVSKIKNDGVYESIEDEEERKEYASSRLLSYIDPDGYEDLGVDEVNTINCNNLEAEMKLFTRQLVELGMNLEKRFSEVDLDEKKFMEGCYRFLNNIVFRVGDADEFKRGGLKVSEDFGELGILTYFHYLHSKKNIDVAMGDIPAKFNRVAIEKGKSAMMYYFDEPIKPISEQSIFNYVKQFYGITSDMLYNPKKYHQPEGVTFKSNDYKYTKRNIDYIYSLKWVCNRLLFTGLKKAQQRVGTFAHGRNSYIRNENGELVLHPIMDEIKNLEYSIYTRQLLIDFFEWNGGDCKKFEDEVYGSLKARRKKVSEAYKTEDGYFATRMVDGVLSDRALIKHIYKCIQGKIKGAVGCLNIDNSNLGKSSYKEIPELNINCIEYDNLFLLPYKLRIFDGVYVELPAKEKFKLRRQLNIEDNIEFVKKSIFETHLLKSIVKYKTYGNILYNDFITCYKELYDNIDIETEDLLNWMNTILVIFDGIYKNRVYNEKSRKSYITMLKTHLRNKLKNDELEVVELKAVEELRRFVA